MEEWRRGRMVVGLRRADVGMEWGMGALLEDGMWCIGLCDLDRRESESGADIRRSECGWLSRNVVAKGSRPRFMKRLSTVQYRSSSA